MRTKHYVVYYTTSDGRSYTQHTVKAATIMGVAEIVARLHREGTPANRWEKVTCEAPDPREQKALEAFLALAEIPVPKI